MLPVEKGQCHCKVATNDMPARFIQEPICPKAHATYWAARTAVMANTMENTRSLMMDMPSMVARQPHDSIPARKVKDQSVSVMSG